MREPTAERTNGRLKEEFGGKHIMVRGHAKVTLHLMFGIIALFADQLLRLISQAVLFYSLSCHPRKMPITTCMGASELQRGANQAMMTREGREFCKRLCGKEKALSHISTLRRLYEKCTKTHTGL